MINEMMIESFKERWVRRGGGYSDLEGILAR